MKSGAKLPKAEQERLAAINETLASLGAKFGQNVLADEKSWALILTGGDELAGLPEFLKDAMASAARDRGEDGKYAVTLSRSIIEPFLTFSERRDLREQAFSAWTARGANGGDTDNREIIRETLALRAEKAKLLGYAHYAALKLDNTMAKTADAVNGLLTQVWEKAVVRAREEEADLARLIAAEGKNHEVMPWDWRHYAEKLRSERFNFSEGELKPYLQLEKIIDACFDVAQRLFGITATEKKGVAGYHPDVRVFDIRDADGKLVALFLGDYFARASKRSGAWMSAFQSQHRLPLKNGAQGEIPIIYNVCNFAKPAAGKPALLSLDDARTLFHEFGHALHGMLSNVNYPSVSGTSVSRDFVELPSQLYEHWLTVPAILKKYAVHEQTGEPMPQALLDKVLSARTFNSGFNTVEFTSSALVDMAFHTRDAVGGPDGRAGGRAGKDRHAGFDRHAPCDAALPACVFRRRLFGRLLFLHVVGSARRRRLRRLRGDRQCLRRCNGEAPEGQHLFDRWRHRSGRRLQGLPRQAAEPGCHAGEKGPGGLIRSQPKRAATAPDI